jgi:hypothetical protein
VPEQTAPIRILEVLSDQGVEFVVVGGLAAVLGGAPLSTFDLDVVHCRNPANIERLLAALHLLDAVYYDLGEGDPAAGWSARRTRTPPAVNASRPAGPARATDGRQCLRGSSAQVQPGTARRWVGGPCAVACGTDRGQGADRAREGPCRDSAPTPNARGAGGNG